MSDDVKFDLIGVDAILAKLESVSYDTKRKGGRAALRRAALIVAAKAQEGAQRLDDKETGRAIADNIAVRWNGKRFKQAGDLGFRIGVMRGAVLADGGDLSENSPTPHWRLLEFGTEQMAAKPFMRPALAENIGEVTATFLTEYSKALSRAIKRAAKKAEKAR